MNHHRLAQNRQLIAGKIVIGIDPSKDKHQAAVLEPNGDQRGASFSFPVSTSGYGEKLWSSLAKILRSSSPEEVIFAIETACNLWHTLAFYLHNRGYTVLLVSPLSTHHARPILSIEFSRTDPKDAYLVATVAQRGAFTLYERFSVESNALHSLGIAYDKLRKALAQNRARVRSLIERVFPEFCQVLNPHTESAVYLLKRYLFPDEFLALDIRAETLALQNISRRQFGRFQLEELQKAACTSVGVVRQSDERLADRMALDAYGATIETLQLHMARVEKEIISRAQQIRDYQLLRSLSGAGKLLSALFLAEVRDLSRYTHYKLIEKLAGLNLRISDSGRYTGTRHISSIGNSRLRWISFKMTEQTARRVPEVRCKYLRRQLKRRNHVKNVVASVPALFQLIVALHKEQRPYQRRQEALKELRELESKFQELKDSTARSAKTAPAKLSRNAQRSRRHLTTPLATQGPESGTQDAKTAA